MRKNSKLKKGLLFLLLAFLAFLVNIPNISMIGTALKPFGGYMSDTSLFPLKPDLSMINKVLFSTSFGQYLWNSVIIALAVVAFCVVFASCAGYALSRCRGKVFSGYIVFLFVSAAIIQLVEPDINRYGDALWYCYAVLSTAGFGDIVAMTFIGKLVSVFVTIYTIFVVAIVTGVVVNYYGQIVEMQRRETAMIFLDKLERLPELSKEELEDISKRVKKFR